MIAFLFTNTLDVGIWVTSRLVSGVYYIIYGDPEKTMLLLELAEIRKSLHTIHKKIDNIK